MIYFLKTEKLEIAVSTFGAELQSIQTKDLSHILWQKETNHWNRIAPILFPIVGRLKDDSYTIFYTVLGLRKTIYDSSYRAL